MELLELNNITIIISWIVTVLIGGVGFKYLDRFMKFRNESKSTDLDTSKMLIDSLMKQMDALTERISKLEAEREEYHKREIVITKHFTEAKVRVMDLERTVDKLTINHEALKKDLHNYREKYGNLDT